jgi:alkaline phosphatase
MGVTTVTAARILDGQSRQPNFGGEENSLSFERFPYLAHAKTYQVNQQVPDSAPTMTAIVTGSKANDGMLSVDPYKVPRNDDFAAAASAENHLRTILERAEERGLWTGVVSTARITHATPGACYAHTSHRDAESDTDLAYLAARAGKDPDGLKDIAAQLLDFHVRDTVMNGKASPGLEVVLGGGRAKFLLESAPDPEYPDQTGERTSRNLVQEWTDRGGVYVFERSKFDGIIPEATGPVLGLFEPSHMLYDVERRDREAREPARPQEPSLTEMTEKAIRILQRSPDGFFLMVEAGRIDHGHHAGRAHLALTDAVELSRAVERAAGLVGDDTLIVVTADHSHAFTMSGYPRRGNPILGLVVGLDESGKPQTEPVLSPQDGKPYTTLGYANGPGAAQCTCTPRPAGTATEGTAAPACDCSGRPDLRGEDTQAPLFRQQALVPLDSETHGGEDVAIYARGPFAHLVQGTMEQNAIYWVMAKALGLW